MTSDASGSFRICGLAFLRKIKSLLAAIESGINLTAYRARAP